MTFHPPTHDLCMECGDHADHGLICANCRENKGYGPFSSDPVVADWLSPLIDACDCHVCSSDMVGLWPCVNMDKQMEGVQG